jgi:FMN-dependent NADH-azoreductase
MVVLVHLFKKGKTRMSTLLHLDSSPLGESSISRSLSSEFVQRWKQAHPQGEVITRDLTATQFAGIDAQWIGAVYTPPDSRTPVQREVLALSDTLISELERADEWVLGVAMHNFSVPTVFKLWLDQVVRAGRTFSYVDGSPVGLLKSKKAHVMLASGGVYDPGSPASSFDFVQPYLRAIFGFMGVTDMNFHRAGGVSAINTGKTDRQTFLQPHIDSIRAQFQPA